MDLNTQVGNLPAVNDKVVAGLRRLGIKNLRQLLFYFPNRHEDRRVISNVRDVVIGTPCVLQGKIMKISGEATFRKRHGKAKQVLITKALFQDESGSIPLVWFHQRFIEKNFPKGTEVILVGTPSEGDTGVTIISPEAEKITTLHPPVHAARLTPIYSETENVSSRFLRYLVTRAMPLTPKLIDYLPETTREEENLLVFSDAIKGIHFPDSFEELTASRKRLAFDELFILQLASLVRKKERLQEDGIKLKMSESKIKDAEKKLPFELTPSQLEAIKQIASDIGSAVPMNRLVAGDVGSGKTVVAGMAAIIAKESGAQVVLAAPTEILATQHAESMAKLFAPMGLRVALLTGSLRVSERNAIADGVASGEIDLLVGTHALFHADLNFKKLGLVVVDEQHRFGVDQRDELVKGKAGQPTPHFLSLTATPIPRTLQLTAYGDVDVTQLDSRPGQQVVKTEVVPPNLREEVYRLLADRMKNGEQVFVICPRVEEVDDEEDDTKSVITEYKKLMSVVFPDFRVGMMHGKLPSDEKRQILADFRDGKLDLLVASSVVEVGVDIPNATALLIEGAERFGLAQLHQFRGRVGRRGQEAVCYLVSESEDDAILSRLVSLETLSNGLQIAEEDLKRRGAGEIYGTRQSGGVKLKVANITDVPFLLNVRKAAERLLERDPELKTADLIKRRIGQLNVTTHFE
ncbi:MAG: ATP-dependent DNA helicase RecG [bacterium]|nr:ATP-dependent DNA helicase RecG [bacterium]